MHTEIMQTMQTRVIPADDAAAREAGQLLRAGQIVAIPTETVYGIAADATNGAAVAEIFRAKGRPQDNPLIAHIDSLAMLDGLTAPLPPPLAGQVERLAAAFWPGPLTVILPRGPQVANEVCAGLDTVAVRMPSHPAARAVIAACGRPLAAPSANRSGSPSPTTAADVLADMDGRLPLILDGGPCAVGVESTVVALTGPAPMLLRPGYITREQLQAVLRVPVALSGAILEKLKEGETARSPGMKYKHYAPRAEVTILRGSLPAFAAYAAANGQPGDFCLCFDGEQPALPLPCVTYGRADDPAGQAHALFRALRALDERGAKRAFARCPGQEGVGLAVYNRLLRAAAFRVIELPPEGEAEAADASDAPGTSDAPGASAPVAGISGEQDT